MRRKFPEKCRPVPPARGRGGPRNAAARRRGTPPTSTGPNDHCPQGTGLASARGPRSTWCRQWLRPVAGLAGPTPDAGYQRSDTLRPSTGPHPSPALLRRSLSGAPKHAQRPRRARRPLVDLPDALAPKLPGPSVSRQVGEGRLTTVLVRLLTVLDRQVMIPHDPLRSIPGIGKPGRRI